MDDVTPQENVQNCIHMMETSINVILHSETVDKREVHNKSPNMEREAVDRVTKHLKESINMVEITTDSSTSVTKMLGVFLMCMSDSKASVSMMF